MPTTVQFYESERERKLARDFDRLRGRLLGLLDLADMEPERRVAAKELVKTLSYASQREIVDTLRAEEQGG